MMNNVIFGYTPDEISDLGYQKADVEKACSILRNIVGLIRRKGLKEGQTFFPKDYPGDADMEKFRKLFSCVYFKTVPSIENPMTDFSIGERTFRLFISFSSSLHDAVPCLCSFYLRDFYKILKVSCGVGEQL